MEQRRTCEKKSLFKSSCSFSTCLRASPYIDVALANMLSLKFSVPYLQQSSDNLVPDHHKDNNEHLKYRENNIQQ